MNFRKLLDGVNVQAYKVLKPSKTWKKLFPRKYTFSLDVMGEHIIFNSDDIPKNFCVYPPLGYIFTYADSLPSFLVSDKLKYRDIGAVFPSCLDSYFTATDEKTDLILSICPRNNIVPATFINEIVVQCESEKLMKTNIKTAIMNIIESYIKDEKLTVEQWARKIIFNYPINNNGLPVRFPKTVDDKSLNGNKSDKINCSDIFIEYDFRGRTYENEDLLISKLEDEFEDLNEEIEITENYNGTLSKIMKELDKKKLKYKKIGEDKIFVKAKYIRDLNLTYELTDFI